MRRSCLLAAIVVASSCFIACEDDSSSPSAPPPAASSQGALDPKASAAAAQTMTAFQALFREDNADPANPMGSNQVSLQQANATLRSSWSSSPTDSRVAFGLAVTTLALRLNELAGTMQRASENGLPIGDGAAATRSTPMTIEAQFAAAARTLATPAKAPFVHELQDTLEQRLLPVLDETIDLLNVSWNDATFEFRVAIDPVEFPEDTLVLDRADVGFALSILQALRAQARWVVAYNADFDLNGSYAWMDTLGNIDNFDALSSAQSASIQHLESLLSNGSSFLKVRPGKEALLSSVPVELRGALQRVRESATLAYTLKSGRKNHLPTITTPAQRDSFLRVVDSGIAWMSGTREITFYRQKVCHLSGYTLYQGSADTSRFEETFRVFDVLGFFRKGSYRMTSSTGTDSYSYSGETDWNDGDLNYYYCDSAVDYVGESYEDHSRYQSLPGVNATIRMNLPNLLALRDLKVFLPRFQWNPTSSWRAQGPISLLDAAGTAVPVVDVVHRGDSLGLDGVKNSITWSDPSFGGVFPQFQTSLDIMEYYRNTIVRDSANTLLAARGPFALF